MKRYRNEQGSPVLNELFADKVESDRFITSHLTVLEANTVAARYLRGNLIRLDQYWLMLQKEASYALPHPTLAS